MCGRYASARSADVLAAEFEAGLIERDAMPAASFNVAPTTAVATVVVADNRRVLTAMRWGLVPSWADDESVAGRLINARLETVRERPAFRDAVVRRRCLLPADGWYEWQKCADGSRQPYYLSAPDGDVLGFAGLWESWRSPEGRLLRTVTIVTAAAPDDLGHVHDRAPVVVPRGLWGTWLDPDERQAVDLLRPTAAGTVTARPVGPGVGDVRNDGPQLLDEVAVVEQPPLF
jgi:putative SOS response-associated peptidase YedK